MFEDIFKESGLKRYATSVLVLKSIHTGVLVQSFQPTHSESTLKISVMLTYIDHE